MKDLRSPATNRREGYVPKRLPRPTHKDKMHRLKLEVMFEVSEAFETIPKTPAQVAQLIDLPLVTVEKVVAVFLRRECLIKTKDSPEGPYYQFFRRLVRK